MQSVYANNTSNINQRIQATVNVRLRAPLRARASATTILYYPITNNSNYCINSCKISYSINNSKSYYINDSNDSYTSNTI